MICTLSLETNEDVHREMDLGLHHEDLNKIKD